MSFFDTLCRELEAGHTLAAVSVVEQNASSPRHAGASMLVGKDGLLDGTIGGGVMEANAIEVAQKVLDTHVAMFMDFDLTNSDAAQSDMICGGKMRLFIEPILPQKATIVLYRRLRVAWATGDDMICVVPVKAPGHRRVCRLAAADWPIPTELRGLVEEHMKKNGGKSPMVITNSDNLEFVVQPWLSPSRLILVGGGHVARATSRVASTVGFAVSILDDREEFANPERFPEAALTRAVPEYDDCFSGFHINSKTFIAIMTRGHLFDRKTLGQALRTEAGYIGMIGSKTKTGLIYKKLQEEGVTKEELDKVYAPIGLAIGAETPEEIAVSIVGQLIEVRARLSGSGHHLGAGWKK